MEGTKNKIWVGNLLTDIDSKQLKEGKSQRAAGGGTNARSIDLSPDIDAYC